MTPVVVWLIATHTPYRERVARQLGARGYTVEQMCSAEGAITRLNYAMPDAIVVAAHLPQMRLFEFVHWVRGVTGGADVPILALVRDDRERQEAEHAACDEIVAARFWADATARDVDRRVQLEFAVRAVRARPSPACA